MANPNIKKDEKTGLYWFKISLGTDPVTGKRRQTTRRGFKKQKEAEEEYNKLKNEYFGGTLIYNKSTKFKDFAKEYKDWYKTQVRPTTYRNREYVIQNLCDHFGEHYLDKITPMEIQKWQGSQVKAEKNQNYIRSMHITLSQMLNRAVTLGILGNNVAKQAGNVKRVKTNVEFWTKEELDKVLATMNKKDLFQYFGYVMLHFLFYTGLRFSEMQALQWSKLDKKNKSIKVTTDLDYKNKNGWSFDKLKNESSNRTILLDDITYSILLEWEDYQKTLFTVDADSFIFTVDGTPTNKFLPLHCITRHSKLAGVKRIKTHALRHSHASFLISLDVNIIAVAQRLGHGDIQEVLKTYGHLYPSHHFNVVQNINEFLTKKIKRGQMLVKTI